LGVIPSGFSQPGSDRIPRVIIDGGIGVRRLKRRKTAAGLIIANIVPGWCATPVSRKQPSPIA
jgi:hypothetical protein